MIRLAHVYEHAKVIVDVAVILIQFLFEIIYSLLRTVIKDKPKDISGEIILVILCFVCKKRFSNYFFLLKLLKDYGHGTWHRKRAGATVHSIGISSRMR